MQRGSRRRPAPTCVWFLFRGGGSASGGAPSAAQASAHFPFRSAREFVTPSGLHFSVSPLEMPGALQRPVSSHGALGVSPVRGLHLHPQGPPQGWATAGAGTDVPGKWSPCSGNRGLAGCHPLSPVNRPKGR